jgi:hypothetical protein
MSAGLAVVGGLVNHLLATGRPLTPEKAQQAAEIVIAGIRRTPAARRR